MVAGTDPLDPNSCFALESAVRDATTGDVTISWPSLAGREYIIRYSDDLEVWSILDTVPASVGSTTDYTDTTTQGIVRRSYEVTAQLAP